MLAGRYLTVAAALIALSAAPAGSQQVRLAARTDSAALGLENASLLDRPARLSVEDAPLADALTRLRYRSGVMLVFSPSMLPAHPVSCDCVTLTVRRALDRLLFGTSFGYVELDRQVLIRRDNAPGEVDAFARVARVRPPSRPVVRTIADGRADPPPPGAIALLATITGQVVEMNTGRPLVGVQLSVPGTGIGGQTDSSGRYRLEGVPEGEVTVRVQLIGYAMKEATISVAAEQSVTLDFELSEQALALDEIVVTGAAGQARRREIGNSIGQIDLADVPEPVLGTNALLQGRVSGVTVLQTSGQVGGGAAIRLRGNVSAAMSNQPLIYVDGVRMYSEGFPKNQFPVGYSGTSDNMQYSPLNDINPANIDRVEIIKGPAATTLYGTEAAAGVIQIFTKSGRPGEAHWTLQIDEAVSHVQKFGPTEGFDGESLTIPENEVNPFGTPDYMYLEPWLDEGLRQKYFLSVSGGREEIGYFLSGAWTDQTGVLPNDWLKQFNLRGNLTFQPLTGMQVQWNTSYTRSTIRKTPTGGQATGVTLNAFRRDRNYFNDKDPEVISQVLDFDLRNYINHMITGLTLTYSPTAALTNRLTVGYDLAQQETRAIQPFGFYYTPTGVMHDTRWENRTLTFDYVGSLQFGLLEDLNSTFSWGGQSVTTDETSNAAYSQNFPGPGEPTASSGSVPGAFENRLRVINAGFFVQNVFDWKNRYFLTAGLRVDGNSAFGSNLGLQTYPKVSASYIISDEPFWNDALGTLKLRAAYGHSGRAPGAFDAVRTWNPVSWGDQVAFLPNNLGNPDLGPERTSEIEAGFDASLFNDHLALNFTYYHQTTSDALFAVRQIPTNGGWDSQLQNVGKLRNAGIELTANADLIRQTDFGWDMGATVSTNHSKTLDLGGATPFSLGNRGSIVEGQPVPVMRVDCITNPDEKAAPIIQRDCNVGPNRPTLTASLSTGFRFPHDITVSARGEYQGGNYAYSLMDGESITRGIRWPACFNSYPAIDAGDMSDLTARERAMCIATNASRDFAVFPLDFFRVREVTIAAPIPFRIPGATSARISLSAQNFFTWKKASESFLDPETSGGFGGNSSTGMNARVHTVGGSIPIPATFVASIRLAF